jgi:hypothetical protein
LRGTPVANTELVARSATVTLICSVLFVSCATPALHYPPKTAAPPAVHELWQESDLRQRDLFYGVGGRNLVPNPRARYEYKAEDTRGASPGYKVVDERGRKWDVKLGEEAPSEVVVSRLLWAIGFHQPTVYYMPPGWSVSGAPKWLEAAVGPQNGARFRLEPDNWDNAGEWSWYENPFVGTRAFKGLVLANLILANWDFKASNNRIYDVKPPIGDASRVYVVQDLGAALGMERPNLLHKLRLRALRGTKNRIDDFEKTTFIHGVRGERVEFDYAGMDPGLFKDISRADVHWVCRLFARLSDRQLNDAFRAAGYADSQRERYIRKIKEKVAQGASL